MRNGLNSNEQTQFLSYAGGNPGAMTFLMQLISPQYTQEQATPIFQKLRECPSIRGTRIYILWSDLCGRDADKVVKLCKNCPNGILEEACSREDYSGREIVEQYLK